MAPPPAPLPATTPVPARPPAASHPRPVKALANVSPAVMTILGLDAGKHNYNDRMKAMRTLTRQLTGNDANALTRPSGAQ